MDTIKIKIWSSIGSSSLFLSCFFLWAMLIFLRISFQRKYVFFCLCLFVLFSVSFVLILFFFFKPKRFFSLARTLNGSNVLELSRLKSYALINIYITPCFVFESDMFIVSIHLFRKGFWTLLMFPFLRSFNGLLL